MKTISIETLKLSIDSLVNVRDNTTIGLKPSEEIYLAAMEMLLSHMQQQPVAFRRFEKCEYDSRLDYYSYYDHQGIGNLRQPLYAEPVPARLNPVAFYGGFLHHSGSIMYAEDDIRLSLRMSGYPVEARQVDVVHSPIDTRYWQLVPRTATAEMIQAGVYAHAERMKIQINDRPAPGPIECAYNAIIRAAPEPPKK